MAVHRRKGRAASAPIQRGRNGATPSTSEKPRKSNRERPVSSEGRLWIRSLFKYGFRGTVRQNCHGWISSARAMRVTYRW